MNQKLRSLLMSFALLLSASSASATICSALFESTTGAGFHELASNVYVGVYTNTRSGRKALSLGYPVEHNEITENGVSVLYLTLNIGASSAIRYDSRMLFSTMPTRRAYARVLDFDDVEKRVQSRIVTLFAVRRVPNIAKFPDSPARFPGEIASPEIEAQRLESPPEYVARQSDGKLVLVKEILEEILEEIPN